MVVVWQTVCGISGGVCVVNCVWCQKAGDRLISCAASGKTTPLTALPMMITDHHPDNNHQGNHHPDGYLDNGVDLSHHQSSMTCEWNPCEFS